MPQFTDYKEIFETRGMEYNLAMLQSPDARKEEFLNLVRFVDNTHPLQIIDIPSGGGYLRKYLSEQHYLLCAEETDYFYQTCKINHNQNRIMYQKNIPIGLPEKSLDIVVSLAGLHHLQKKDWMISEMARILKDNGKVIIADVWNNSCVAKFLNEFVDANNSIGHLGYFLDEEFNILLNKNNFNLNFNAILKLNWIFNSLEEMTIFCKNLFGLDKIINDNVVNGIEKYLGFKIENKLVKMNWELKYICGTKFVDAS
ncbi:methyltransferase domain-containing protein [Pigmentibacter sp. JX0631]|uniref:methyltransferase domain-containing protein n=1 Tax=Pigmentibacter sp. JX0631 TaxID=2976982 RepID=UPI002468CD05|nr:methyltransferase domain-containing protein [Pigmentibacter sp. JX0631]WGL60614.1 methyltransferase domain-containing protein [Pigmentibacter sp. JX0631]